MFQRIGFCKWFHEIPSFFHHWDDDVEAIPIFARATNRRKFFGSNHVPQLPVNTKQTQLGPFASFPGGIISINGSVFRRTPIIINFPTDR